MPVPAALSGAAADAKPSDRTGFDLLTMTLLRM